MSGQGKGIPHLMALYGKCLVSCNSNLESQCVLSDLICCKEHDNCYGYQTTWTIEVSGTAPGSWCPQVSICKHMSDTEGPGKVETRTLCMDLEDLSSSYSPATTWL